MEKGSVTTGEAPRVFLEVNGDLDLKGFDDLQVVARPDSDEDLQINQDGDEVYVRCTSNCSVRVPRLASVEIKKVDGNATLKALDGELVVHNIDGDFTLRSVGKTRIDHIGGNLSAKRIDGNLVIDQIDGDVVVKDIGGSLTVAGTISGNVALKDVQESATVKTGGDLALRFDPSPGGRYEFTSEGNINCRIPDDASAKIRVLQGSNVQVDAGETHVSMELSDQVFETTIGEGAAELIFSASGDIQVKGRGSEWKMEGFDFDFDLGNDIEGMADQISQQVSQQIEAQMDMLEQQLESRFENLEGLPPDVAERIAQRAREASARATARAQEKMQRAQEKIQRKMEAAQRKVEHQARASERRAQREKHSWSFHWPTAPMPPMPPMSPIPPMPPMPGASARSGQPEMSGEPVSEEERLMILRMLEQKKITLEEAEQLLSALEGKAG